MALPQVLRHPLLALAEGAAALLERLAHVRAKAGGRRGSTPDPRQAAGRTGERLAYFHLRRHGYVVVARQWRAPNLNGELDLIAWQGDTLCFVEVKTRTRTDRFAPSYAIGTRKQQDLRRMAAAYVHGLPWQAGQTPTPAIRFDSVSVLLDQKPYRIDLRTSIF